MLTKMLICQFNIVAVSEKKTVVVEHEFLQTIFNELTQIHNFVSSLKKIISDQNSWIDILVSAMTEKKKTLSSDRGKDHKRPCGYHGQPEVVGSSRDIACHDRRSRDRIEFPGLTDPNHPNKDSSRYPNTLNKGSFADIVNIDNISGPPGFADRARCRLQRMQPRADGAYCGQGDFVEMISQTRMENEEPFAKQRSGGHTAKATRVNQEMCPMCQLIFDENDSVSKREDHVYSHF